MLRTFLFRLAMWRADRAAEAASTYAATKGHWNASKQVLLDTRADRALRKAKRFA